MREYRFEHSGRSLSLRPHLEEHDVVSVFEDGEELMRVTCTLGAPLQASEAHVRELLASGQLMTPIEAARLEPFDMQLGPFSDLPELDAIAHQMFRQFSRFEYALKAAKYLTSLDGDAKPDWDLFASDIHESLTERLPSDEHLQRAVQYIRERPPKKQIVRNGSLAWSSVAPTSSTETGVLLQYVRRVRNNLFHGGKFSGHWIDPDRSEELIRHSLTILHTCLSLSDRVREAFEH